MKSNKTTGLVFVLALFAAILIAMMPLPTTHAQVIQRAEDESVVVSDKETVRFGPIALVAYSNVCSGFVAASSGTDEIIVTASHCLFKQVTSSGVVFGVPDTVTFFDGDHGKVAPEALMDPVHDILIIRAHTMRKHPAASFSSTFSRGDDFFTFGQPEGYLWSYGRAFSMQGTSEVTAAKVEGTTRTGLIEIGVTGVSHGSSGGAVFDADGNVVGMVESLFNDDPAQALMTAASYIQTAVQKYQKAYHK